MSEDIAEQRLINCIYIGQASPEWCNQQPRTVLSCRTGINLNKTSTISGWHQDSEAKDEK